MKKGWYFMISLILIMGIGACRNSGTAKIEEGETLGAVVMDQSAMETGGLVVYQTGTVLLRNASGEKELNIGDLVQSDDTVLTESGAYCEIQIGDTAVIRIEEETVLSMASLSTSEDKTDVRLDLKSGTVLCKVEKLLGKDDSFKVQTESAVCGVRGTRFSVTRRQTGETLFAVKEGQVAVVPPVVDDLQSLASQDESVAEAILPLTENVVFVDSSQQFAVSEGTFQITAEALAPVEETLARLATGEKADEAALLALRDVAARSGEQVSGEMATASGNKEALSGDNAAVLERTDTMAMFAMDAPTGGDPAPRLFKMAIKTVPPTASIEADGVFVGTGAYSKVYPEGTVINLTITEPGYETYNYSLTAEEKRSRVQTIRLTKSKKPVETVTPDEKGSGTETGGMASGDESTTPVVNDKPILVAFKTIPDDAEITVNNEAKGTGAWSAEYKNGETLSITVTRNGFESKTMNLTVGAGVTENVIQLEPKPFEARYKVSSDMGIGSLIADGDSVYFADGSGTIHAVSITSGVRWTRNTANKPNENSLPVVEGGNLWFSGVKEMVIVDKASGKVKATVPLSGDMVHLFGSRILPVKDTVVFPANNSLFLMARNSGEIQQEIPIPGGTRMTPGLWKSKVLIVNQKGSLLVINIANGSVETEIQTQAVQPVAISVTVHKDLAAFCGRKGTVSVVNLADSSIAWERNLSGTIYNDIATGTKGCYVFMSGTLTGLGWKSGADLFKPVTGVSCPPLVAGNQLVYVTDGNVLVIADAGNGKTVKRLQLPGTVATRPAMIQDRIVVLSGSEILVINPEGITE